MKKMNMTELSKPVAYIADCGTIVSDSDPFFDDYKNPQPIYSQEYVSALLAELEAKDKRIAELEAKLATPVRLPTALFCPEEYVGSLLWSETEAYNKAISKCAEGIRAAGLKVEGMSSHAGQKHMQEDTPDGKKS